VAPPKLLPGQPRPVALPLAQALQAAQVGPAASGAIGGVTVAGAVAPGSAPLPVPQVAGAVLGGARALARAGMAVPVAQSRQLPNQGLRQSLQAEGVIKGQIEDAKADNVTDFVATFDKSDVLKPIQRTTVTLVASVVAGNVVIVQIEAPVDQIVVIRKLALTFSVGQDTPDFFQVTWLGAQSPTGEGPFLFSSGPFPLSGVVIGDVVSPFTQAFNDLLPISIYPGGRIQFRAEISGPGSGDMTIKCIFLQEIHYSPFRPAGL